MPIFLYPPGLIPPYLGGEGGGDSILLAPLISTLTIREPLPIVRPRFEVNQNKLIEVEGRHFTPEMSVTSNGLTINSFQYISENKIIINANSLQLTGEFDLNFNNGLQTTLSNAVVVQDSPWIDLRKGSGESFEIGVDLVVTNNVIPITNTEASNRPGMWFKNAKTWRSAAAFEKYKFTRGNRRTVEIIFNNYNRKYMIGIGKNPRKINASNQFYQAELLFYFRDNYRFFGLYGNRNKKAYNLDLEEGGALKAKFTDDITLGSKWFLYKLNSVEFEEWNDESQLIITGEVDDRFKLEGEELFPIMLPQYDWNNYITAFRVY